MIPAPDTAALQADGYHRAAALSEVPALLPLPVHVDGHDLLLCRHRMRVYAVAQTCPHEHVSLAEGTLANGHLVCPMHRYEFALDTGECANASCSPLPTYDAVVAGGTVWVRVTRS